MDESRNADFMDVGFRHVCHRPDAGKEGFHQSFGRRLGGGTGGCSLSIHHHAAQCIFRGEELTAEFGDLWGIIVFGIGSCGLFSWRNSLQPGILDCQSRRGALGSLDIVLYHSGIDSDTFASQIIGGKYD